IEPLLPRDPRLAKRICSPTEFAELEQADDPERATILLWSAKEAEGKRRGTGLENAAIPPPSRWPRLNLYLTTDPT
ncbi:MAG: 4-phosphopantetheinyl transferase family protein, partial [Clostridia bacterium]|nr:4-phosphopantetheinyl transferase family protein [Clostridia bacterium]